MHSHLNFSEAANKAVFGGLFLSLPQGAHSNETHPLHTQIEWNFKMSNMRLNNAVEEALGQSDECRSGGTCLGVANTVVVPAIASGAEPSQTRLQALRINHAEDEQYGMRHHD